MKKTGQAASAYLRAPEPDHAGLLIFSADSDKLHWTRRKVAEKLVGPDGEKDMRLTRISAAELRKDPAMLSDALKAIGFFPGPRLVSLEDAGDGLTATIATALESRQPDDAFLLVTAGSLAARSKLRKLFETGKYLVSVGLYDDPPDGEDIRTLLQANNIKDLTQEAKEALSALSRTMGGGEFEQMVAQIGLYTLKQDGPLSAEDIFACAPVTTDAAIDDAVRHVAEAQSADLPVVLNRLYGQGVTPVGLCIAANRHFQTLFQLVTAGDGAASVIGRLRPPVFGPRRDALLRQSRAWRPERIEQALRLLMETDLSLRSSRPLPAEALVSRALIRISMLRG